MERWFWCDIHYACFGFSIADGVVKNSAPIFSWAKGKSIEDVNIWLRSKNAAVVEIK